MSHRSINLTKRLVVWLLAVFVLAGCSESAKKQLVGFDGSTMGTSYSLRWVAKDDRQIAEIQQAVEERLALINQQMSTYIRESEVSRFNALSSGEMLVSAELASLVQRSQAISKQTAGAFDITVGPLVNLWGFGPEGRVVSTPSGDKIASLRARVGYQKLGVSQNPPLLTKATNLQVDLSAIAKGYAVDQLASLLAGKGINNYLVEIGGEIKLSGNKPNGESWRIAIEAPLTTERAAQHVFPISNIAMATSGGYRNYFEEDGVRYSHTINPLTGAPIRHALVSVTVLHPSCADADALATALMVMGDEKGVEFAKHHDLAAYFLIKAQEGGEFESFATAKFDALIKK
jgi:thiamine biosynthesis lipoprotein